MATKERLTVEVTVNAPIEKVWDCWIVPEHITKWNYALDEWMSPSAENDLRVGGKFNYRMEAKDGSVGFDFIGEYEEVVEHSLIRYVLADDRRVDVRFEQIGESVSVREDFEPEDTNPADMQKTGWQNILDNFKKYVER